MNKRYGLALPLAGMLVVAGLALDTPGESAPEAARSMQGMGEGAGIAVSMDDFRGVVQERAGYAITMGHYVGRHRAVRDELAWWQNKVSELSGSVPGGLMVAYHGARQERLGYRFATVSLADRRHGTRQELLGHRVMLAHLLRTGGMPER